MSSDGLELGGTFRVGNRRFGSRRAISADNPGVDDKDFLLESGDGQDGEPEEDLNRTAVFAAEERAIVGKSA